MPAACLARTYVMSIELSSTPPGGDLEDLPAAQDEERSGLLTVLHGLWTPDAEHGCVEVLRYVIAIGEHPVDRCDLPDLTIRAISDEQAIAGNVMGDALGVDRGTVMISAAVAHAVGRIELTVGAQRDLVDASLVVIRHKQLADADRDARRLPAEAVRRRRAQQRSVKRRLVLVGARVDRHLRDLTVRDDRRRAGRHTQFPTDRGSGATMPRYWSFAPATTRDLRHWPR